MAVAKAIAACDARRHNRGPVFDSAQLAESVAMSDIMDVAVIGPHVMVSGRGVCQDVVGMTVRPKRGRDRWWLVGRVFDELADEDFSVCYMPGDGRVGTGGIRPRQTRCNFNAN